MKMSTIKLLLATVLTGSIFITVAGYNAFLKEGFTMNNLIKVVVTFLATFIVLRYLQANEKAVTNAPHLYNAE